MHENSFYKKKREEEEEEEEKLIVAQLESDEETEQIHKHTLKYALYRISFGKMKSPLCQIKQISF